MLQIPITDAQGGKRVSKGGELLELIATLKLSVFPCENVITRSIAQTNVHVLENIIRQEAILLPAVHHFFISCASETSEADQPAEGGRSKISRYC